MKTEREIPFIAGGDPNAGAAGDALTDPKAAKPAEGEGAPKPKADEDDDAIDGEGETPDPKKLLDLVKKLRGEVKDGKATKRERDELAAKVKAADDAKLSETERTAKERDDAKAKLDEANKRMREIVGRSAVQIEAMKLGAVDPDDVYLYLSAKGSIEFDDDGEPKDIAKAVAALKAAKPHLFGAKPEQAAGVPGTPKADAKTPDAAKEAAKATARRDMARFARSVI